MQKLTAYAKKLVLSRGKATLDGAFKLKLVDVQKDRALIKVTTVDDDGNELTTWGDMAFDKGDTFTFQTVRVIVEAEKD